MNVPVAQAQAPAPAPAPAPVPAPVPSLGTSSSASGRLARRGDSGVHLPSSMRSQRALRALRAQRAQEEAARGHDVGDEDCDCHECMREPPRRRHCSGRRPLYRERDCYPVSCFPSSAGPCGPCGRIGFYDPCVPYGSCGPCGTGYGYGYGGYGYDIAYDGVYGGCGGCGTCRACVIARPSCFLPAPVAVQTPVAAVGAVCGVGGCVPTIQPAVQTCTAFGCSTTPVGPPNLACTLPSWV